METIRRLYVRQPLCRLYSTQLSDSNIGGKNVTYRVIENFRKIFLKIYKESKRTLLQRYLKFDHRRALNPVRNIRARKGGGESSVNLGNDDRDIRGGFLNQIGPFVLSGFRRLVTSRCGSRYREVFKYRETAGPLFALVGVSLVGLENDDEIGAPDRKLKGFITRQDEIEAICDDIREAVRRCQFVKQISCPQIRDRVEAEGSSDNHAFSLKDFEISDVIDKGCNAVVYAAKWKNSMESDSGSNEGNTSSLESGISSLNQFSMINNSFDQLKNEHVSDTVSSRKLSNSTPDLNFAMSNFSFETKSLLDLSAESDENIFKPDNVIPCTSRVVENNFSRIGNYDSFQINRELSSFCMNNNEHKTSLHRNSTRTRSSNAELRRRILSGRSKQLSTLSLKYLDSNATETPYKRPENRKSFHKQVRFSSSVKDRETVERTSIPIANESPLRNGTNRSEYPLAVKMVFNYEAASNAPAILSALYRELIPARSIQLDEVYENWRMNVFNASSDEESWNFSGILGKFGVVSKSSSNKGLMPPHPNVVDMPCVFVDKIPTLPGRDLYPNALPPRINPEGFGRNMSLFCVMRRYDCPLDSWLSSHSPSPRCSLLLFAQLLEALLHLNTNGVAHRDLKPDNILLLLNGEEDEVPWLVLTDFGCCLAVAPGAPLSAPFPSRHCDPRQGNMALMAPEVKTARPGVLSSIDFSSCDFWAAATIAYQLFGQPTPFIRSDGAQQGLNSATYKESQIPPLRGAPSAVARLVRDLLRRKPHHRPPPHVAATVAQMALWAPDSWLQPSRMESSLGRYRRTKHRRLLEWLISLSSKLLYEKYASHVRPPSLEFSLVSTFLSRVRYAHVLESISWARNS